MTREHIWADWLSDYIPKTRLNHTRYKAILHRTHIIEAVKLQSGDPKSRRVRCVCKDCNTGWMSKLQEAAKPHLVPMISSHRYSLSIGGQHIVAAWAAMLVMVAEQDEGGRSAAVHHGDHHWLKSAKLAPPNWRIWIGHFKRGATFKPEYSRFSLPIAEENAPDPAPGESPLPHNTQATTFVVGDILFHAMSTSPENVDIVRDWQFRRRLTGSFIQLSPLPSAVLNWPLPSTLSDDDADIIATDFMIYCRSRTTV